MKTRKIVCSDLGNTNCKGRYFLAEKSSRNLILHCGECGSPLYFISGSNIEFVDTPSNFQKPKVVSK